MKCWIGFREMPYVRLRAVRSRGSFSNITEMIRVASKYPNIAKDYFYNKKHQTVDIIKLNGSVELGPIIGAFRCYRGYRGEQEVLSGENGLEVLEEVCPLSARMIVNQVSMQMQPERIKV